MVAESYLLPYSVVLTAYMFSFKKVKLDVVRRISLSFWYGLT